MSDRLNRLKTDTGERETYDAVSQCSRCGYCLQACPTFVVTGREAFSGRGRNQVVRMMLEGKLKDPSLAEEALSTCLLCGACTSACYAHVPTADLVLEGRRALRKDEPWLMRALTSLLLDFPGLFAWGLRAAHLLKASGLARLVSWSGLLGLLGLEGLAEAEGRVHEAPLVFLGERLWRHPELCGPQDCVPNWLYFAACGPNYLYPRVGLATLKVLRTLRGPGAALGNACCGLPAYNYGSLEAAREFARRNILAWESKGAAPPGSAGPPVVGDCSSCVAHLKSYPQLFLEDEKWRARAEGFARAAQDVLEAVPEHKLVRLGEGEGIVTYHDSCRARNAEGLAAPPRSMLTRMLGSRFVELPEAEWCCGGAGAFGFLNPELSQSIARRKASNVAYVRADLVLTSSTSCLIQIDDALRKYYPGARVRHLSEFLSENLS